MKTPSFLAAFLLALLPLSHVNAQARDWTNSDGKTIVAEQTGYEAGKRMVALKSADGKIYDVALSTLSMADADRAKAWKPKAPGLLYPTPDKLADHPNGVFGLGNFDCHDLFGLSGNASIYETIPSYDVFYKYTNASFPNWTITCLFSEDDRCIELIMEYTSVEDNFGKYKIPTTDFMAWMPAVGPVGHWKEDARNKQKWVNDKTLAEAEITEKDYVGADSSGHKIHYFDLKIRSAERLAWLASYEKQLKNGV